MKANFSDYLRIVGVERCLDYENCLDKISAEDFWLVAEKSRDIFMSFYDKVIIDKVDLAMITADFNNKLFDAAASCGNP